MVVDVLLFFCLVCVICVWKMSCDGISTSSIDEWLASCCSSADEFAADMDDSEESAFKGSKMLFILCFSLSFWSEGARASRNLN